MNAKICAMPWLPDMPQVILLKHRWHSFWACDREHVTVVYPSKGCQYLINGCLQPIRTWMIQNGKLKMVHAPLTLILRMERWTCCCLCCLYQQPIHRLCIKATKSLCKDRNDKTTNRWRSVDSHSVNGAVTVLLSLLPTKAANTSVTHKSDEMTV